MQQGSIVERIDKIAAEAAIKNGVEFVHSEMVGSRSNAVVRIYIDKPGGVTIEDCSIVSRAIEDVMDAEDFMPSAYVLEVSSPGLERPLFTIQDFKKFAGKKVKVKTSEPIGTQANFTGRVAEVDGDEVVIEDKTNGIVRVPFDKISKAHLKVDLAEEFKKKR